MFIESEKHLYLKSDSDRYYSARSYNISEDDFHIIDGEEITNLESFHSIFSEKFNFIKGYGKNWDAFIDAMRDVTWDGSIIKILYVKNPHLLLKDEPESSLNLFLDCMNDVSIEWKETEYDEFRRRPSVHMITVLTCPDDELDLFIEKLEGLSVYEMIKVIR